MFARFLAKLKSKSLSPKYLQLTWQFGLLLLFILGLFIRFWQLNSIPVSYYHDELDYVLTGESILQWGTDLSGHWQPQQLQPLHTLNYMAELPSVFHAGLQLIFGAGVESGHVPAAVFGLLGIGLLAALIYRQTKQPILALAVLAVLAVNPWHIHLSRMGYEAIISLFFQLSFIAAGWCFAQNKLSSQKRLAWLFLALGSLFFGFFTYHAAKFTLAALVGAMVVWQWLQPLPKKWKLIFSVALIGMLVVLLSYTWNLQQAGTFGARQGELLTPAYIGELVDDYRQQSLYIPGSKFLINKLTVGLRELSLRYLSVFDVYRLFGDGYESGFQFSLVVHSFFYLSSLPIIFLGIWWWLAKQPQLAKFWLWLLLFSPVASVISVGYQSIFRSGLTYIILLLFVAGGLTAIWQRLQAKQLSWSLALVIMVLFLLEALNFGVVYLSRYGVVAANNHYFSQELLAGYVGRTTQSVLVVVEDGAYSKARSILAYNHWLPSLSVGQRQQFAASNLPIYSFENFTVDTSCPNLLQAQEVTQLVDQGMFNTCHYAEFLATTSAHLLDDQQRLRLHSLSSPIDSGAYFYVINDQICADDQLKEYVYTNQISDFNPVDLTNDHFCRTWMKLEKQVLTRN